jgi:DNA-binding response OmpR family regulator
LGNRHPTIQEPAGGDGWPALKADGYEVIAIRSITEAIRLIRREYFDLFVVSGNFPDGKGVEFVRQARSFNSNTPILMIAGEANAEDIEESLGAGASAYMIKPVENQDVIQKVKSLIASSP